jgi:MFS transporter, DHA1 family, inner membrane transport protein
LTAAALKPTGRGSGRMGLFALGLGAFVVGTAELLVVGVLGLVARDLRVSIATAGVLVTGYAIGISVGGPLLTALTIRFDRRRVLWLSLVAYVAGNALALVAGSVGLLLVARVATGCVHGLFVGVAFAVAAGLVPEDKQGQAMSVVMGGITVAIIIGVPVGTAIGQALGWRAAFAAVVILGLIALAVTFVLVPPVPPRGVSNFSRQRRAALAPPVLAMLAVGLVVMGGQFTAFTYLAAYLQKITRISGGSVSLFLLAYGIAAAAGTFLGGKAADRSATWTLIAAGALLPVALGLLYLGGSTPALAALLLAVWGLVGFGLVPALQLRIVGLAGEGGDLAATLGASAVNLGIAAGSLAGGAIVSSDGVRAVLLSALIICAAAFPATWASRRLGARDTGPQPESMRAEMSRGAGGSELAAVGACCAWRTAASAQPKSAGSG